VITMLPMTPARRVWLAIGVPVCLVVAGWVGLNLVALAGPGSFSVSHAIPARTGRVSVNVSSGRVHLQGTAGEAARLTGTAHYSLIRPPFTTRATAAGTDFGYRCDLPFGNCDLDATVSVPRGMATAVHTGGGRASVTGTTGDVSLSTDGGSVSAEHVSGDLTLTTDGGNVTATAITAARVSASTSGGRVTLRFTRVPADVTVSTGGGDITIVLPPGGTHYRLTERAFGGTTSAHVPTDSSSPNVITATSDGGDISVSQS
jgi:Toastrack DUF4097